MYLLEIDQTHNRIHLTLSGRIGEPQAKALLGEIQSRINELNPDFHVLCDLTALDEFAHSARPYFRSLMELCNEAGVRKIVRIAPNPLHDFGLTVMSHFHYDHGIPIITCRNLDEALKHLERT